MTNSTERALSLINLSNNNTVKSFPPLSVVVMMVMVMLEEEVAVAQNSKNSLELIG